MPEAQIEPRTWERLIDVVRARTQLRVTERNLEILRRLVERRIQELDLAPDEYLDRLCASTPQGGEFEHVTRELTVGETYFFRGSQLEDIRSDVLSRLIDRRRADGTRTLRLLSAGCATGEEPYTLVMMLSELLDDFEQWRIDVLGLDLNTTFLRTAEAASYSDWSLRDVPTTTISRFFTQRDGRYHVLPRLREKVRFYFANLALDPLPAPALGIMAMDLILCQNVLYYFEPDTRTAVAEKLARCLAPDGYLVFGPSDLIGEDVPQCRTRTFGGLIAFQRATRLSTRPPSPLSSRPAPPPRAPTPAPFPAVAEAPGTASERPPPSLDEARALANDGDLQAALAELEESLSAHPDHAEAHALHGFLLTETGALEQALEAFRRSTYLDSDLLIAHAGAAMTARRLGQAGVAKRAGARVRTLANRLPPDTVVEGWDGMTTGRLLRLFEDQPDSSRP